MQRLVQRFDSSLASASVLLASGRHDQRPLLVQQLRQFMGEQRDERLAELLASEEARRLLAALSQLIGHDNILRLGQVLVLNRKGGPPAGARLGGEGGATEGALAAARPQWELGSGPALDLRKQADRRLALAWLRFLAQMSQKAIESVQLLAAPSPEPCERAGELLLSPQALPQSDAPARLERAPLEPGQLEGRPSGRLAGQFDGRHDEYSNGPHKGRHQIRPANCQDPAGDKLSGGPPGELTAERGRPNMGTQSDGRGGLVNSELDSVARAPASKASGGGGGGGHRDVEDPIRLALERITGRPAAPCPGRGGPLRSGRRQLKGADSHEDRDHETRLQLGARAGQVQQVEPGRDESGRKRAPLAADRAEPPASLGSARHLGPDCGQRGRASSSSPHTLAGSCECCKRLARARLSRRDGPGRVGGAPTEPSRRRVSSGAGGSGQLAGCGAIETSSSRQAAAPSCSSSAAAARRRCCRCYVCCSCNCPSSPAAAASRSRSRSRSGQQQHRQRQQHRSHRSARPAGLPDAGHSAGDGLEAGAAPERDNNSPVTTLRGGEGRPREPAAGSPAREAGDNGHGEQAAA